MDNLHPIAVGVSSCLLGEGVRYDGGHKRDACIVDILAQHFELVSLCPEMAIGMGVPRPPIRLTGDPDAPRAMNASTDVTLMLAGYAESVAVEHSRLRGYIFKQGSPSCGLAGVPVYAANSEPCGHAAGLYAGTLLRALPGLPAEEETALRSPEQRQRFIERVLAYHRSRSTG